MTRLGDENWSPRKREKNPAKIEVAQRKAFRFMALGGTIIVTCGSRVRVGLDMPELGYEERGVRR